MERGTVSLIPVEKSIHFSATSCFL
jgi:hypothetical protein